MFEVSLLCNEKHITDNFDASLIRVAHGIGQGLLLGAEEVCSTWNNNMNVCHLCDIMHRKLQRQ